MISKARPSFWRAHDKLSPAIKQRAKDAYMMFADNPDHPSLRFKKPGAYDNIWSVRINEQYRAVGVRSGDTVEWIWIGTHNEFDKLFT